MTNKQESILYRTGQAWKYNTSLAIDGLGIIMAVISFYYYFSHPQLHLLYFIVSGVLLTIGFFIKLRIKCPKCGTLWYWHALKAPLGDNGLGKLRSHKTCPICEFSGKEVKQT
ncbi:MAG: hypothetical protein KBT63_08160 [Porticoccaceae bacterium]|nr:hypothetical protein [Porticoccaceae bacterium]